jgi:hypothetical protein
MSFRALRLAVTLGISVLLSGAPQVVSAASPDCCDERCEGSGDDSGCPPTCSVGACAKVRPAMSSLDRGAFGAPATSGRAYAGADAPPVLPVVTTGVFHPPRY